MGEVASRELRNDTRALLRRVEAGEHVVITVDGRPVAVLAPLSDRTRWMSNAGFVRPLTAHQADAALSLASSSTRPRTIPTTRDDARVG
jgi:prevent-host-death family protein